MTIKLLVAIQGAGGVEIPAGTEVTLSAAVEAAHVSANKAVYTTQPMTFDAPPSSGVGVVVDRVTGGSEFSFGESTVANDYLVVDQNKTINKTIRGAVIQFYPGKVLTLGAGGRLIDCFWDFSRITKNSDCPNQFIAVSGDNIRISGCKDAPGYGLPLPFVFTTDSSIGRFIGITGDSDNLRIYDNELFNGFYAIYGYGVTVNNLKIRRNKMYSARNSVLLNNILGKNIDISANEFPATLHTSPVTSSGEINVFFGFPQLTANGLTNSSYETRYGKSVRIERNRISATSHRAIYLTNVVGFSVSGNDVNADSPVGDNTGVDTSDDVIVLELCRRGDVVGNIVHASGENGIDFLGCKDITSTANIAVQCDAVAMMYDWSDTVKAGYAEEGFKTKYHLNERIKSHGNIWSAGDRAIGINSGKHIKSADHISKFFGYRTAVASTDIGIKTLAPYASKALGTWPEDLDFSGVTKDRVESIQVSAVVGTDTLQFASDHDLKTGDRTNLWLETPASGTMPTGLDDITDYYVIRIDEKNIKLATTNANARAGTAITWSGSLTGNLWLSELQSGYVYVDASPGFDLRGFKLSRDLATVSAPISVSASANYSYVYSGGLKGERDNGNIRFGYMVRDAATQFGESSNLSVSRMIEFGSGFTTDAAARGIVVQWAGNAQVKFRTGTSLLPVSATPPTGSGSGTASITSGYVRAIIQ